ncbi:hypothetical protein EGH10_06880 [Brevibacillus laterosporus]|uniref:ABC-type transport system, permease n=1 Tax=Brevibacillus laterosporus LMG 15441 TaxID=1042163 RepID=A0A075R5R4_BRELA|nr:ABC-2 family transporter protein [Brevibacillus laterosporus]HAS02019.1 hypothetical protein [Brevibacillus sp.]AIG24955.1 ABC-type transport system, permease [Brevibacillus laterosporus LMG 15441]MDF9413400.1 hypothetical protein [Brevibacillus laterosporus]RJL11218.1 hypothetical protein DM460_11615 [Brevibacillus laterosporus]TPH15486.1 hypothetical protein EGH10_06880 [Brevibacillus laterosporus]
MRRLRSFRKYIHTFQLGIQTAVEYRANFVLGIVGSVFSITILTYLWTAIFDSQSPGSTVFGYTFQEMITYTLIAAVTAKIIQAGFEYDVAEDIKEGGLNKFIIRPIGYLPYKIYSFLGSKLIYIVVSFCLIFLILFVLNRLIQVEINLVNIGYFLITLLLALVLNFFIFFSITTIAFWLENVSYIFEAPKILLVILSGGIFPLDVFDDTILSFLNYLPFKYTVNYPVDVLIGKYQGIELVTGMGLQVFWIIAFAVLSKLLWGIGIKKYIAIGG